MDLFRNFRGRTLWVVVLLPLLACVAAGFSAFLHMAPMIGKLRINKVITRRWRRETRENAKEKGTSPLASLLSNKQIVARFRRPY